MLVVPEPTLGYSPIAAKKTRWRISLLIHRFCAGYPSNANASKAADGNANAHRTNFRIDPYRNDTSDPSARLRAAGFGEHSEPFSAKSNEPF